MLMEYLNVPYNNKTYELKKKDDGSWSIADWAKDKYSMDMVFPNLPYLIDGDVKISQHVAILNYIARKVSPDMLGKTLAHQAQVDSLMLNLSDLKNAYLTTITAQGDIEKSIDSFMEKSVSPFLTNAAKQLGQRPYIVGDYLTIVDFNLYEMLHTLRLMRPDVYSAPDRHVFKPYIDRIASLPRIAEYIASDRCCQIPSAPIAAWQAPSNGPRG